MNDKTIKKIKQKLTEQIALSIGEEPSNITTDIPLHELGLDSLGLVELFVFIEKEFKIQLMESGISQEDIKTIDSLSQSVNNAIKNL